MLGPESGDVCDAAERVWQHGFYDQRGGARVCLCCLVAQRSLQIPGDPQDACADEDGACEVDSNYDRRIGEHDVGGQREEEVRV